MEVWWLEGREHGLGVHSGMVAGVGVDDCIRSPWFFLARGFCDNEMMLGQALI